MAVRNLQFKKFRSFLTILGVVIGVGSVFFLMSFGLGLKDLVQKQIIGSQQIQTIDVNPGSSKIITLSQENIERFKHFGHVEEVATTYSHAGKIGLSGAAVDTVVFGADNNFANLIDFKLVSGNKNNNDNVDEVVINTSLLSALNINNAKDVLNKSVSIIVPLGGTETNELNKDLRIVGVIESGAGAEAFVSNHLFEAAGLTTYSQAKLVIDEQEKIGDVRKQVEALGFQTSSPVDTLEQVNQVFKFFNLILLGFGGIGMLIAILGMLNTLTISLLERTQEIGLMVALGGRSKDMRSLFIAEAITLSLLGSLIGILGAFGLGLSINALLNQLAKGRGVDQYFSIFATPLWLVALVLVIMAFIGFMVVIVPARRAARINPIDALRHE